MSDTCHELLLRLAGRLPDDVLWRFRDWAATDAILVLARTLPRTLLHDRIGLTDREQALLVDALVPHGADRSAISSVRGLDEPPDTGYTFTPESPDRVLMGDSATVVLGATLRGRPGVGEVRSSWRLGGGDARRLILVAATSGYARLAGELQRVLRALGEHDPCVEVLPAGLDLPPYHRAALAASELVCTGAEADGHLVPV
ncbi:hypothetical protein ACFFSW_18955 [Saccharothrix longispora]|uniref:Uncharacterized protein n=1 Tax=Saccharothrix longispora TaxID=33920 RepID=A0ABU1Q694_9PSEU|nr:hypothetical protein [Saccharothrix longispora]MBY8847470.1 hypothetical protein [Saccharothrix sp. MB29]MDR6597644.1 hypothetical protein [Saccharothrix longispora]MDU0288786.1 hypothetical protein [Saccharothrix longispora]